MEAIGHAGHSTRGRRALTQHQAGLTLGRAMTPPLRRGEAEGYRRGNREAFGCGLHQGGVPPRVASQSCSRTKKEWEMENV